MLIMRLKRWRPMRLKLKSGRKNERSTHCYNICIYHLDRELLFLGIERSMFSIRLGMDNARRIREENDTCTLNGFITSRRNLNCRAATLQNLQSFPDTTP